MIAVKTSNDPRAAVHNGYVCKLAIWSSNFFPLLLKFAIMLNKEIVSVYVSGLKFPWNWIKSNT